MARGRGQELGSARIVLEGSVTGGDAARVMAAVSKIRAGDVVAVDLSAVTSLDSAGVAALLQAWRVARRRRARLVLEGASPEARRSLSMFRVEVGEEPPPPTPAGFFESVGDGLMTGWASFVDLLQLAADSTFGVLGWLARPGRVRWAALVEQSILIGSQALPIIGLISFLVGLTLAFQSAYQLRQFGADIFVANLTGVAMIREMGPLMTAILVSGRSGSSIAAEIATMKVSEEVDALTVMGMDPLEFLALPRLVAMLVTVPLLTVLSDLLGILGGFVVGIFYLDISFTAFLRQTLDSLGPGDLTSGLFKSVVFAWGIALIGLHYGFQARGGAAEVGRNTTSSVVASIFFVIIADSLFSILLYIVL